MDLVDDEDLRRSREGAYATTSMRSRAWSTLPCVAPSISRVSRERPSSTSTQDAHAPQGVAVGRSGRAAVDRGGEEARRRRLADSARARKRYACANRLAETAFVRARTISSCPTTSANVRGRHSRARGTKAGESLTKPTVLEMNPGGRQSSGVRLDAPGRLDLKRHVMDREVQEESHPNAVQEIVVCRVVGANDVGAHGVHTGGSGPRREGRGRPRPPEWPAQGVAQRREADLRRRALQQDPTASLSSRHVRGRMKRPIAAEATASAPYQPVREIVTPAARTPRDMRASEKTSR